jgi:hypothetical protein
MATQSNSIFLENRQIVPISNIRAWVQLNENTLLFVGEEWKKVILNFYLRDEIKERIVDHLNFNEQKLFPTIETKKNFKEGMDLTLTYTHTRMFSLPLWMITRCDYVDSENVYHFEFSHQTNIPPLNMPMTLHPLKSHFILFEHIKLSKLYCELLPQHYNLFLKNNTNDSEIQNNNDIKYTGGAVFIYAKGADVSWFKKFVLEVSKTLYNARSHKHHFLLMKNDCLWVCIDHESSDNMKVVCQMILKYILWGSSVETRVEIDNDCCVTQDMMNQMVEFEYNDSRIVKKFKKIEGAPLPVDHMIICVRDHSNLFGGWSQQIEIGMFERFKKKFKKLWPDIKAENFHFIIFKYQNKEKSVYLYIHVDGLSNMCLNASFDAIAGQDFLQSAFRDDITLENLKSWSIDDQVARNLTGM